MRYVTLFLLLVGIGQVQEICFPAVPVLEGATIVVSQPVPGTFVIAGSPVWSCDTTD